MHRKKLLKNEKNEGVSLFRVIYFSQYIFLMTSIFYFAVVRNIIVYINILKLGLINTGFDMFIIQRFKNSTYLAVKYLKGVYLFREQALWPQFLFHFPVRQLIVYIWVEFSEIGIIFRTIMNRKILKLP